MAEGTNYIARVDQINKVIRAVEYDYFCDDIYCCCFGTDECKKCEKHYDTIKTAIIEMLKEMREEIK